MSVAEQGWCHHNSRTRGVRLHQAAAHHAPQRRSDRACSLEHRFILASTSICDGVTSASVSITSPLAARAPTAPQRRGRWKERGERGGIEGAGRLEGDMCAPRAHTRVLRLGRQSGLVMQLRALDSAGPIKVCDVLSIIINAHRSRPRRRRLHLAPQFRPPRCEPCARPTTIGAARTRLEYVMHGLLRSHQRPRARAHTGYA